MLSDVGWENQPNGSGAIPAGVATPIPLPIIYFSKIDTQKQREKDGIRHEASTRPRTGFIFEIGRQGTSEFLKRFRILSCLLPGEDCLS